jgi:hypothetical protein
MPGRKTTVTDIALASGFNQLGRFAASYRKNFGEHPSTTIERTRKSSRHVDLDFDEAIRLTMEALPLAFAVAPAQCDEALEKLDRPQELAPSYALPKAIAAWCWGQRAAHRFRRNARLRQSQGISARRTGDWCSTRTTR